ncbi:regulatory LuxR family protein [Paraburkholderia sp. BL27I4N3]|uniref:helix-turn-helix transcriptional regulator n=1 Tax=Paraburkholderia sp. BL27I4N3 TaxID=1938805 RepID=UPI000E2794CA|nr:autoinducer binding domain-containing protein [Paraburkholderia sp. BL27I4N3]REE19404.1 regulatory LuxR family protein [Paraburkholderia sp. BL27I4N3]
MIAQQAPPEVGGLFEELMVAKDDSELASCVKSIVTALGGESYVFVSLHPSATTATRATHRFLIGCRPEWCQMYNANKWYMTDPFLEYARSNTAPITGSEIVAETQGQREMLVAASKHGFRSGIVVPVHASATERMGVLYIGSDDSQAVGEKRLTVHRLYFRALAMELLDWSIRMTKREILEAHGITEMDLRVVGYLKNGFTAEDIAREMDISVQTVYVNYRKIKDKIGVSHISEAVKFAEMNDLLA